MQIYNIKQKIQQMEADNVQDKEYSAELVLQYAAKINQIFQEKKEIDFEYFFKLMLQFCKVFKLLNTFLGIAFSDVTDKVRIMRENNKRFQGHPDFLSYIKMQMSLNIHKYNGGNNKDLKAPKEYSTWDSTSRNLLRLMWLLTFIKVTFEGVRNPKATMSEILCKAYETAFGQKHSWIIRNGAKLAIKASTDRKSFMAVLTSQKYNQKSEQIFAKIRQDFLANLTPFYQGLWAFYKENKLTELP